MNQPPSVPDPPKDYSIWELGRRTNWELLSKWLDKTGVKGSAVSTAASEGVVSAVRRLIEESTDRGTGQNLILTFVSCGKADLGLPLLKRVLALGVSPDGASRAGRTAIDLAQRNQNCQCGEALISCRPDLSQARNKGGLQLSNIPERAKSSGFPSIAELVCRADYWAVKNLTRRQIVSGEEALHEYRGRTAVQWAEMNREMDLARELKYLLFNAPAVESGPSTSGLAQPKSASKSLPAVDNEVQVGSPVHEEALKECFAVHSERMSEEMNELCESMEQGTSKLNGIQEKIESFEQELSQFRGTVDDVKEVKERIRAVEEKLKCGTSLPAPSRLQKRKCDPRLALIDEILEELGKIATDSPTNDLLQDLLSISQKHNKPRLV